MRPAPYGRRITRPLSWLITVMAALLSAAALLTIENPAQTASAELPDTPSDGIDNIGELLNSCPQNNPRSRRSTSTA